MCAVLVERISGRKESCDKDLKDTGNAFEYGYLACSSD